MDDAPAMPERRSSRFWLFAPFVLLVLIAVAWTAAWFVVREKAAEALDRWLTAEANRGRQWTCPNRGVGGFPFRLEVRCDSLVLQRPDMLVSLGPVSAVAQVYRPRHVIVRVAGPLRAGDATATLEGNWRSLEASIHTTARGLERTSVVIDGPDLVLKGLQPADLRIQARRLETHLRPSPARASEAAYDWSLAAAAAQIPSLDLLIGGTEPADLDVQLTATQVRDPRARPSVEELERWRQAGGRIEVTTLRLAKGPRRIEGRGEFGLDDLRRPQGRADLAAAGVEGVLGAFLVPKSSAAGALLGALTGRSQGSRDQPEAGREPDYRTGLRTLPPLRLENGRVYVGPLALPGVRIPSLY
jgi:hypothetical protein